MIIVEHLKKWNGGIMRGAQTKLAKRIHIVPSTIAQWVRGSSLPNEDVRQRVAKEFGITVDELMASFQNVGRRAEQMTAAVPDNMTLGRLDQLTKQIAELQEQCGELKYRMGQMERGRGFLAADGGQRYKGKKDKAG